MYTLKIPVENPNYLATVASISFMPSDFFLNLMLKGYCEYSMSPVSCILVFKGKKLIKKYVD